MPKSTPETRPPAALSLAGFGLLLVILIAMLGGCGQKGDLTLDSEAPSTGASDSSTETSTEDDQDNA